MIKFIKTFYTEYVLPICREIGTLVKYVIGIENKNKNINTIPSTTEPKQD